MKRCLNSRVFAGLAGRVAGAGSLLALALMLIAALLCLGGPNAAGGEGADRHPATLLVGFRTGVAAGRSGISTKQ